MRIIGITRRKGSLSVLGSVVAASILVSAMTPGSAVATTLSGRDHSAAQASSADAPSSRMAKITCKLSIDDPYLSRDESRSVKVVATVSCTAPVKSLEISVKLYRNGELARESGLLHNNGSATLQGTAAQGCTDDPSDQYFGIAKSKVTYPFGYSPPTWEASTRSFTSAGLDCDSSAAR